jgi:N-acetylglucosaminyldiphosphoundecaprenol N-acetyl-beta-D-mannosaminyltransferase
VEKNNILSSIKISDIGFFENEFSCEKTYRCVFLNPHSIVSGFENEHYRNFLINDDTIKFVDGIGLKLKYSMQGKSINRFTGRQFFLKMNEKYSEDKILWIAGHKEDHEKFKKKLSNMGANSNLIYQYSPPFRPNFSHEDINEINVFMAKIQPKVVFVCVGAPKQELLMGQLDYPSSVQIIGGIGAVYDFILKPHLNAPFLMRKFGFEWLYRLMTQPRKNWRRTFYSLIKFFKEY